MQEIEKTIAVGQTVTGSLTTTSPRSASCAGCFAELYTLTVTSTQRIDVRLNSSAFDAFLQILTTNGSLLADDDDSGGGTNARIIITLSPGTYLIEVTTAFEEDIGGYSLALTLVQ